MRGGFRKKQPKLLCKSLVIIIYSERTCFLQSRLQLTWLGWGLKICPMTLLTLHIYKNCKHLCLRGQGEIISLPCLVVWLEQTGAHFCIYLRVIIRAIVARLSGRRPARRSLCRSSGSRGGSGFIWWWRLESIQQKKTLLCILRSGCCTNKLSVNAKLLYTSTKYSK